MHSDEAGKAIATWAPRLYSVPVADFTRQVVCACGPESAARARALIHAVAKIAAFAERCGLALSAETVMHPSVIERFLAGPGRSLSHATARTVATNLRHVSRQLSPVSRPDPLRLSRERAKTPYSQAQIDHYLSLAANQPTESRRMRATALISLGAGAGLTGADLRHVRGCDVAQRHGGLVVTVAGCHPRIVPILARFHEPLVAAAAFARDGFIVGGVDRTRKNVTSGLVASLAGGDDLAALDMRRLRSTWLTSAAQAIGLRAFMDAAGVDCSQRLGDIVFNIEEVAIADAVKLLSGRK